VAYPFIGGSLDRIESIKTLLKSETENSDSHEQYKLHLVPVVEYSKKLAEIENADKEVTELAAWLHDIGRIRYGPKDHHITGANDAEKILRDLGYPQKVINHVKDCILTHRCDKGEMPKTMEAKIIASADAMAHFETIPWLITTRFRKMNDIKEVLEWVLKKVNRGWEEKILVPEGKEMIKEKYKASKIILESTLHYLNK
jgi:uncharacterized protein